MIKREQTRMTTIEILRRARKILTPRKAWIQGSLARDANGNSVSPGDPRAVCWCAGGAIVRAGGDPWAFVASETEIALVGDEQIATWNDVPPIAVWNDKRGRTHREVLAMFDAAINWLASQSLTR